MSAVTLETLRAEFDRHIQSAVDNIDGHVKQMSSGKNTHLPLATVAPWLFDPDRFAVDFDTDFEWDDAGPDLFAAYSIAHLYIIARDHGLQAAMLYKLSDGAIDPRGAA